MTRVAILIVVCGAVLIGPTTGQAQESDRLRVVNCYDPDRELVRKLPAWRCKHEIVSDDKARIVRQNRIRRAKQRFARPKPLFAGMRMRSSGTGFFVSRVGHILTNNHVIDACKKISIKPSLAENHRSAALVAANIKDDLAILQFLDKAPAVGKFRQPLYLQPGHRVGVVGHPLHGLVAIKPILVIGSVRDTLHPDLIRMGRFAINADIRRGNSGGPVLDDSGFVVGVVSAKVNTPAMYKRTGTVMRDVGLIIRQDLAIRFLKTHGVPYLVAASGPLLTDEALRNAANEFVGRVGCWR